MSESLFSPVRKPLQFELCRVEESQKCSPQSLRCAPPARNEEEAFQFLDWAAGTTLGSGMGMRYVGLTAERLRNLYKAEAVRIADEISKKTANRSTSSTASAPESSRPRCTAPAVRTLLAIEAREGLREAGARHEFLQWRG